MGKKSVSKRGARLPFMHSEFYETKMIYLAAYTFLKCLACRLHTSTDPKKRFGSQTEIGVSTELCVSLPAQPVSKPICLGKKVSCSEGITRHPQHVAHAFPSERQ